MNKEKILTKLHNSKKEIAQALAFAVAMLPAVASATNAQATNLVFMIVDKVVSIFPLVGIFFIAAGFFKLIMAYREDNPQGQSSAAKDIVIGAVFIVFRVGFWVFDDVIRGMM